MKRLAQILQVSLRLKCNQISQNYLRALSTCVFTHTHTHVTTLALRDILMLLAYPTTYPGETKPRMHHTTSTTHWANKPWQTWTPNLNVLFKVCIYSNVYERSRHVSYDSNAFSLLTWTVFNLSIELARICTHCTCYYNISSRLVSSNWASDLEK